MDIHRRTMLQGTAAATFVGAFALAGRSSADGSSAGGSSSADGSGASAVSASLTTYSLDLDRTAWNYDEDNDVYWQIGNVYVTTPAAKDYETLGIYVPGAYFTGKKNSSGTYTTTVARKGTVGKYTATTAPIVFPVNTPGYAAQKPPTSYSYDQVSSFMKAGLIYVAAGLRGRDSSTDTYAGNAPWGVTDLKAAVRYVRYNAGLLPGDTDRMFVFGHSGGGAQSSVMGASGDSPLYKPYLQALGAAMTTKDGKRISDAIAGVMAWCPITSLDYANASYEWNMGQFSSTGTRASGTWTAAYSKDLSNTWVEYVNALGLRNDAGKKLSLAKSSSGIYLAGSYYDHLVGVVQKSLNDFLSDTTFPYTPSNSFMAGMDPAGATGGSGQPPTGAAPSGSPSDAGSGATSGSSSTTYQTVQDYIDHLNADEEWVSYDAKTNTATITGLAGFVRSQKNASKDVGAFDGIDRNATENVVMGIGTTGLHFAPVSEKVIAANEKRYATYSDWKSDYAASGYTSDFKKADSIGKSSAYRLNMYNPMYFLCKKYAGYKSASVAPHWRIRTGIMQGDTASTTEVNLMLALQNYGVQSIDFATVWGLGHTMAERTGDATTNFIEWVHTALTA